MQQRVATVFWALRVILVLALTLSSAGLGATSDSRLANILRETTVSEVDRRAGAVTLLKESSLELDEDAREGLRQYVAVQVFDDQAIADYAEIQISYNAYHTELTLDFARVLYPDGRIEAVADDAVQAKTLPESRSYSDVKFLTFALPTLESGAAFEYQVTSTTREQTIRGHAYGAFSLSRVQESPLTGDFRIDPVLRSRLTVKMPNNRKLVYAKRRTLLGQE